MKLSYFCGTHDQARQAIEAYIKRLHADGLDPDRARAVGADITAFLDSPKARRFGLLIEREIHAEIDNDLPAER